MIVLDFKIDFVKIMFRNHKIQLVISLDNFSLCENFHSSFVKDLLENSLVMKR